MLPSGRDGLDMNSIAWSFKLLPFSGLSSSFGQAGTYTQGDFDLNGTVDLLVV